MSEVVNFSSYSDKNLAIIKDRWPEFHEWLIKNIDKKDAFREIVSGKNKWLVGDNFRILDKYEINHNDLKNTKHALWLIAGLGSGDAFINIFSESGKHVVRLFLLETSPGIWWSTINNYDLSSMLNSDKFWPLFDLEKIEHHVRAGTSHLVLQGLWTQALYILHKGEAEDFCEDIKKGIKAVQEGIFMMYSSLGNSAEDTLFGFYQMSEKVPALFYAKDLAAIMGKYEGLSAVVIGGGPSLDKNFHLLHEIKDKSIIIATEVVLRKCLRAGIRPHFVCSLERDWNLYTACFRDLPDRTEDVVLVSQAVCVSEIAGTWKGPFSFVTKLGLPLDEWFGGIAALPVLRSGACISHMCYTLALSLGCKAVAFIGQDLSFGPSGEHHTQDTYLDGMTQDWKELKKDETLNEKLSKRKDVFPIPGLLGGEVLTDKGYYLFKKIFEYWMPMDVEKGIRACNCTEGGARIEGTERMTFRSFIDDIVLKGPLLEQRPNELLEKDLFHDQARVDLFRDNLQDALDSFSRFRQSIDKMEAEFEKVLTPGVSNAARLKWTESALREIDVHIGQSQVFTFIGQAHMAMLAGRLAPLRALRSRQEVDEWHSVCAEFLRTQRTIVDCMEECVSMSLEMLKEHKEHEEILRQNADFERWGPISASQALSAWRHAREGKEGYGTFPWRLCTHYDFVDVAWPPDEIVAFGRLALARGMVRRARNILGSVQDRPEMQADAAYWNDLGVAALSYDYLTGRDVLGALKHFSRAIRIDPSNDSAEENLIAVEQALQEHHRNIIDTDLREEARAAAAIGDSFARLRLWEKAMPWFERGLRALRNGETPQDRHEFLSEAVFVWKVAGCCENLKKYDEAERKFLEAVSLAKDAPEYLFELLCHYLRRERKERAADVWGRLLASQEGYRMLLDRTAILSEFAEREKIEWLSEWVRKLLMTSRD